MAVLSITVPAGDLSTTLASAAGEAGYTTDASGVKTMTVDFLKGKYRDQKRVEAQRTTAATVDAAVASANTNAAGIA